MLEKETETEVLHGHLGLLEQSIKTDKHLCRSSEKTSDRLISHAAHKAGNDMENDT